MDIKQIKINKKTIKNKTLFQVNEMVGINYWCIVEKDEYGNKIDIEIELNPIQTKVLKIALAMIEPKNEIQDEYSFTVKEIMEIIGLKGDRTEFVDMPNFLRTVMKHDRFEYRQNNNTKTTIFHIFDKASYCDVSKVFTFTFSFEMIRKLNGIPEKKVTYTSYPIIEIFNFNGKYDIQLFEIFKKNSFKTYLEIELEELRKVLNVGDKYKTYYELKRNILAPAIKKINETKCITVEKEIGTKRLGRKVGILIFKITKKDIEPKEYMIVENIVPELKPYEYKNIYIIAKKDINIIAEKYNMIKDRDNIKSMYKYLLYAIDNDIKEVPKKTSTFNNFEQRTYDFDDLEKKLLGWDKVE